MDNIKVGDIVEEVGTDSGWWVVTEVFRNSRRTPWGVCLRRGQQAPRAGGPRWSFAAKLALKDRPDCTTFVPIDRLAKVG